RALDTMQKIFTSLSAKYPDDLMKQHMPKEQFGLPRELPHIAYEPRAMAYAGGTGPKVKKLDELPALWVGAQFLTSGPDTPMLKPDFPYAGGKFKVIYEEILPNTDVAFRVLLATPSPQFEKDMIQLFAKEKSK